MGSFCVKLLMCWITFLWSCGIQVGYSQYNVYRQDPFAILSRTLLTYQQAACDGQVLNLVCPTSTKISIQLVQYGRTAPSSQVRTFSQTWHIYTILYLCTNPLGWFNFFLKLCLDLCLEVIEPFFVKKISDWLSYKI